MELGLCIFQAASGGSRNTVPRAVPRESPSIERVPGAHCQHGVHPGKWRAGGVDCAELQHEMRGSPADLHRSRDAVSATGRQEHAKARAGNYSGAGAKVSKRAAQRHAADGAGSGGGRWKGVLPFCPLPVAVHDVPRFGVIFAPAMYREQILAALSAPHRPTLSVEFFPPKDAQAGGAMLRTAAILQPLGIDFASITYGAGGTSRDTTLSYGAELVRMGFPLIGHLTCVGHSSAELESLVDAYDAARFSGILALRGDPPKGQTAFTPHPEGFSHAEELVRLIGSRGAGRFAVGVAGFPERHPESVDATTDVRFLAQKVRAGADFVTTQLFLDNADYFHFVESARAAGVSVPIIPGIMPVLSLKQARNFCGFCKARIPEALERELEQAGADDEAQRRVGVSWAVRQIRELFERGAPGCHLYILNRAESAVEVLGALRAQDGGSRAR